MSASFKPRPLKNLFTTNGCWAGLLEAGGLRHIEVESVSKMLACGTSILGVKHYACASERCPHVKYLCNTCHCRACPSCGKKATDQWIAVQNNRLPDCAWYHLVFTLPDTLWPVFFHNRGLLDALCRLAADNCCMQGSSVVCASGCLARSPPMGDGSIGIPMCTCRLLLAVWMSRTLGKISRFTKSRYVGAECGMCATICWSTGVRSQCRRSWLILPMKATGETWYSPQAASTGTSTCRRRRKTVQRR